MPETPRTPRKAASRKATPRKAAPRKAAAAKTPVPAKKAAPRKRAPKKVAPPTLAEMTGDQLAELAKSINASRLADMKAQMKERLAKASAKAQAASEERSQRIAESRTASLQSGDHKTAQELLAIDENQHYWVVETFDRASPWGNASAFPKQLAPERFLGCTLAAMDVHYPKWVGLAEAEIFYLREAADTAAGAVVFPKKSKSQAIAVPLGEAWIKERTAEDWEEVLFQLEEIFIAF